jgi:hypothetical protein
MQLNLESLFRKTLYFTVDLKAAFLLSLQVRSSENKPDSMKSSTGHVSSLLMCLTFVWKE